MATKECSTELQSLKHCANDIEIPESSSITKIYNNNKTAVHWAASVTSKGIKHLNLKENMVQECYQSKYIYVEHIPGIINPSDIFMNEMKYNTHFRNLRDSIIFSLQAFLKYNHNVPTHIIYANKSLPYNCIRSKHIVAESLELKSGVR